jgi:hypothetical protein
LICVFRQCSAFALIDCAMTQVSSCTAPQLCLETAHVSSGPFVYRLGRQVFNLERGVRLPYGLPHSK